MYPAQSCGLFTIECGVNVCYYVKPDLQCESCVDLICRFILRHRSHSILLNCGNIFSPEHIVHTPSNSALLVLQFDNQAQHEFID